MNNVLNSNSEYVTANDLERTYDISAENVIGNEAIRGIAEMGYLYGVSFWDLLLGLCSYTSEDSTIND